MEYIHKHDWQENLSYDQECTKCGELRTFFNWSVDNCKVPDAPPPKEPYVETKDFTFSTDDEIRQILSGGNCDYNGRKR